MAGSAVRASTAPPAGSEAAPASAITPFGPTMIPGVASPWISSSAVMVENAAPSRTVRPSLARAPAIVSQTEATAATSAPVATSAKWTQDGEVDLAAADGVQHGRDAHRPCANEREQPSRCVPLLHH